MDYKMLRKKFNRQFLDYLNNNDLNKAQECNIQAYEKAIETDNKQWVCEIIYRFGLIADRQGHINKALKFFENARALSVKIEDRETQINALNGIARIYFLNGRLRDATKVYVNALNIINDHNIIMDKGKITNNLALIFKNLHEYDKAIKYLKESYECALKSKSDFTQIGSSYNLSEIYIIIKNYDEARKYLDISKNKSYEINNTVGIGLCMALEGYLLCESNRGCIESKELFEMSIKTLKEHGEDHNLVEAYIMYGRQAHKVGKYNIAKEILEKAVYIATKKNYFILENRAIKLLEKIYSQESKYEEAYQLVKRQLEIQSNLNKQWEKMSINHINENYEEVRTDIEVNELKESIRTMKILAHIGKGITASGEMGQIFDVINENISKIMPMHLFGIGLLKEDEGQVDCKLFTKNSYHDMIYDINDSTCLMARCIKDEKEIVIYDTSNIKQYQNDFCEDMVELIYNDEVSGVLFCPMYYDDKIIGGVMAQGSKESKFTYIDRETIRLLTSYIAIAISNSQKSKKLMEANKKLKEMSNIDGLTRVYNRHALGDYIVKVFDEKSSIRMPISVLMIDLDFFKQYNDTYGHFMGDSCLKATSKVIVETVADFKSSVFRYGGDEFLVIIENCDYGQCQEILENIQSSLRNLSIKHKNSKISEYVTLTIGAAVVKRKVSDYIEVFHNADEALYVAKNKGRNLYAINEIQ